MPRGAAIGAVADPALAIIVYLLRVLELFGPFAGTREYPTLGPEDWLLLFTFVLTSATALFATAVLTFASAYRLSKTF